jgi:nucleoside-diphosphate-sugar epimerase
MVRPLGAFGVIETPFLIMRILVSGSDGYIGSVLVETLVARGHEVEGLDTGFYAVGEFHPPAAVALRTTRKDIRDVAAEHVQGFDAVAHLAELSNDPLALHDPALTYEINHRGSVSFASACRQAGVSRFVYSSSCSVYGLAEGTEGVDESSSLNPQTPYAACKALVERDVAAMASDNFSPVFLRNATAFGASPRLRFDLVLNNLAGWACTARQIRLISDGSPWRPLVHVRDIAQAFALALESPRAAIHNAVLNVGSDAQNYQVRDIATIVAEVFPGCELVIGTQGGDTRSYRVQFGRIGEVLPTFSCQFDARSGAEELRDLFEKVGLTRAGFESTPYTRLHHLQKLLADGRLSADLRWRTPVA